MVLTFISQHLLKRGYPPTIREIAENLGVRWTHGVERHLIALEKKGYINRTKDKSRGIRLSRKSTGIAVPIIKQSAHSPMVPLKKSDNRYIVLDPLIAGDEKSFLVQVDKIDGIDLKIDRGDYVLVAGRARFKSEDIVAEFVAGEGIVVHRILERGTTNFKNVDTTRNQKDLLGKVVAVIRLLS